MKLALLTSSRVLAHGRNIYSSSATMFAKFRYVTLRTRANIKCCQLISLMALKYCSPGNSLPQIKVLRKNRNFKPFDSATRHKSGFCSPGGKLISIFLSQRGRFPHRNNREDPIESTEFHIILRNMLYTRNYSVNSEITEIVVEPASYERKFVDWRTSTQ